MDIADKNQTSLLGQKTAEILNRLDGEGDLVQKLFFVNHVLLTLLDQMLKEVEKSRGNDVADVRELVSLVGASVMDSEKSYELIGAIHAQGDSQQRSDV